MRAYYHDHHGMRADLCQYATGTTRLTVRDNAGTTIHREEYRTWDDAKAAMHTFSDGWRNSILDSLRWEHKN